MTACEKVHLYESVTVGLSDDTIAQNCLLGGILLVVEGITLVLLLVAVYPVNILLSRASAFDVRAKTTRPETGRSRRCVTPRNTAPGFAYASLM